VQRGGDAVIRLAALDPAALSAAERATEIRNARASLDDIEKRYARDCDGIARWLGPADAKQRLLGHLDARRSRERQPLVAWLATMGDDTASADAALRR
jgi:hypothetical protein